MALVLKDRVKETTTTAGTGTVTLAGAAAGFQSFAAVGNGNQTFYAIVDAVSGDWEVGVGTYTASGTTLSRTTVVSSSNAGSLVPFSGNAKDVFVTYPSSRAVYLDAAGSAVTTLDIGTLGTSTANTTTANITAGTITTPPTNNTDIVNKQYADAIATGIHFHEAVDYATTAALPAATYNNGTGGVNATLTGNVNGALTVDGYTFTSPADNGTRILVKNQANGAENGVYTLSQAGNSSPGAPFILTRATDFDSVGTGVDQIDEGDFFLVTSGTANANTAWVQQTPPPIIIGTTAIVFQQFSAPITYTAGTGLSESPSYTFNIANIGTAGTYGSASSVPVITTNAQGQVTGVTPTAIAISGSAVSGNISGSAGSVANALTIDGFLTGGSYNGSAPVTIAVDATSANTANKVVARDASGNFSAGTITATLSGSATSATTATNLAGGAANQIPFQTGAGATSFAVAPSASNQVLNWNGSAFTWSAGTISGIPLGSNLNTLTFGTFLTGTSYNGSSAVTIATNATSANTASTLVARDASGNFSAGTITAALTGNASTATTATNVSGGTASVTTFSASGVATFSAGSAAAPAITTSGDTNTGIFFPAADTIAFSEGGAESMRLNSAGRLGIGTTTPSTKLDVQDIVVTQGVTVDGSGSGSNLTGNTSIQPLFGTGYDSATQTVTLSAFFGDIRFYNDLNVERMRIAASGNLGLGVTPSAWGSDTRALQIFNRTSLSDLQSTTQLTNNGHWNGSGWIYRETAAAGNYNINGNTHVWRYAASGTAGNAISFTEAMRIDSSGNLGIGTSSPATRLHTSVTNDGTPTTSGSATTGVSVRFQNGSVNFDIGAYTSGACFVQPRLSGNNASNFNLVLNPNGGNVGIGVAAPAARLAVGGDITATGNITAYFSDERLKTKLGGIENALDKVEKLSGFYYEANETAQALGYKPKREVGVSAQQIQAVMPEVVSPAPIDPQYLTVDYERLVPLLIEAIKELRAEVKALKGSA